MPLKLILMLLALAALLAGCGDDGGGSSDDAEAALAVPWVDPDGDPPYIGSLSVNPGDGSIFMGTNTGPVPDPEGGRQAGQGHRAAQDRRTARAPCPSRWWRSSPGPTS